MDWRRFTRDTIALGLAVAAIVVMAILCAKAVWS